MNNTDFIIEEATAFTPEIGDAVIHLSSELDTVASGLKHEDIVRIIEAPHTRLFLAMTPQEKKIVGMITLVTYRIPNKMKGIIEDVVVDSEFRKKGIGGELVTHALKKAKEAGVTSLDFTSHPSRVDANRLYQKLGFQKRDTNVYRINL